MYVLYYTHTHINDNLLLTINIWFTPLPLPPSCSLNYCWWPQSSSAGGPDPKPGRHTFIFTRLLLFKTFVIITCYIFLVLEKFPNKYALYTFFFSFYEFCWWESPLNVYLEWKPSWKFWDVLDLKLESLLCYLFFLLSWAGPLISWVVLLSVQWGQSF